MTEQWKPIGDKWPQPAMVMVRRTDRDWATLEYGACSVSTVHLHPMPPAITPEQQAVLDAVKKQEIVGGSTSKNITAADYDAACRNTNIAVRAMLAAQQPPDPVQELLEAAKDAAGLSPRHARLRAAIAALEAIAALDATNPRASRTDKQKPCPRCGAQGMTGYQCGVMGCPL